MQHRINVLLFLIALILTLPGCGSRRIELSSIPVFPEAEPISSGQSEWADAMAGILEGTISDEEQFEVSMFMLPNDVEWIEVRRFYSEALSRSEWQIIPDFDVENDTLNRRGWSRGANNAVRLVVSYTYSAPDDETFMLVGLFTR